jgi:dUTP pyrophosphatase
MIPKKPTEIKVKLGSGGMLPRRATDGASGYDLRASVRTIVLAGPTYLVMTGVFLELPEGWEAQVRPRSGLSRKGVTVALGTIDADYRGEVGVCMTTKVAMDFQVGDRIAQLVFVKLPKLQLVVVSELTETARGAAGFGSTGVK